VTPAVWPTEIDLGGGVSLRRPDAVDAEAMVAAINVSLDHLGAWMAWAQEPASVDQQSLRLAVAGEAFDLGGDASYTLAEGDDVIGSVGLHTRLGAGAYEIGYWIRPDREGRGIVTAAVLALVRVAFDASGTERVEIHCDEANARSAAVARRAAFTLVDTFDDADRNWAPALTGRTMVWERRR
jgi:RimJ/RimL family protein N-acetyltransferase